MLRVCGFRKRSGAIVNLLSTVGMRGGAGEIGYAVTNGGAMALTRGLAAEVGRTGVRVNGVMLTWAENAFDPGDPTHVAWLDRFAMGRVTRLDEVARVVAFLASTGVASSEVKSSLGQSRSGAPCEPGEGQWLALCGRSGGVPGTRPQG
ncbi:MAG: SDR family oxidoreductase [Bacillota bacterium]